MKRPLLMTPGPSPVPYAVREALAREIIHHRTQEFRDIFSRVSEGLKKVFRTKNPVITLASSGTGAMESGVNNFFSPGDKVIVVDGGKFGQRWKQLSKNYELEIIEYNIPWGQSPCPDKIRGLLKDNPDVKGVFTTLCETSTATVYDIEGIAGVVRESPAILMVDAVSGLGQDRMETDEWGIDIVVSGSQKGLMLPPGLGFISVSGKAGKFLENRKGTPYYFDLKKALKSYEKSDTPFTPAVSLIVALEAALDIILDEGVEERWQRFSRLAGASRKASESLGLKLFSQRPSESVTAVLLPDGVKAQEIVKKLREKYDISIACGQDDFKDRIIRVAHMGAIEERDMVVCFYFLEKILLEAGCKFKRGASLAGLGEVLYA